MNYQGKICPNCFDLHFIGSGCRICGYRDEQTKKSIRAIKPGTVLKNRYVVGKVLGEGGFGITYKVLDLKNGGIIALKEYIPNRWGTRQDDGCTVGFTGDRIAKEYFKGKRRFLEEATMLQSMLGFDGIVDVYDFFEENNTAYYSMEFLDGANLSQIVDAMPGGVPYSEITGIIKTVGMAMDRVHRECHILHRDITPDNIMVTKDGKAKLFDFGNARMLSMGHQQFSVVLKYKFAPPEQYSRNIPQGPYTDVYGLAASYYLCLTGRNIPMAADRLSGENYVRLSKLGIGVPNSVSDAVDRALVLDYKNRTQTMDEFVRGISGGFSPAPGPTPGSRTVIKPYIEALSGRMAGIRWDFPADHEFVIGRQNGACDIVIQGHDDISRKHLCVRYAGEEGVYYVKDISSNGTYQNGTRLLRNEAVRIVPPVNLMLSSGCVIRLSAEAVRE